MFSLFYFIREAFKGFKRNISTALGSVITSFLSLLIIGVFLVCGTLANNLMSSVESEVSITAYLADDADQTTVDSVQSYIESLEYVASVTYTSKEEALEDFMSSSTNSAYIEQLDGENPLPASLNIELTDPEQVSSVVEQIATYPDFQAVCDEPDNPTDSLLYGQGTVERMFQLIDYVRYAGVALVALLVFIALVFINNTIRLAILARRKEIAIMRLVGASNGFIRGPFLTEGALHALIGSLLAVGVIELARTTVLPKAQSGLAFLPLEIDSYTFLYIYGVLIVSGLVIGLIGSAFAMRRYLKV